MAKRKTYLVTIKMIRQADGMESATRWANCTAFDIKYRDNVDNVKWSVQELPDDDNDNKEAAN